MTLIDGLFLLLRVVIFIAGVWLSLWTISQALRSFVLPRSDRAFLTNTTFRIVHYIFSKRFNSDTPFADKDRILAMLSPVAMFLLPIVWLSLLIVGYAGMYYAIDPTLGVYDALVLSGSSLMTLGFAFRDAMPIIWLGFSQAALGMMLVALLIGYLPTMYSAFSLRESMVTKLETVAGTPPRHAMLIKRLALLRMLDDPDEMKSYWQSWQDWFVQIEENHTTLAPMNFFRSPAPDRHWLIAAGCILDTAAIIASSVKIERAIQSAIAITPGFIALRTIADYFDMDYNHDPNPNDPISIHYEEFIAVLEELQAAGVPLYDDWEDCWDHFSGWRVNYDEVLLQLAWITTAPYGYWSSDRAMQWREEDIPLLPADSRLRERSKANQVTTVDTGTVPMK